MIDLLKFIDISICTQALLLCKYNTIYVYVSSSQRKWGGTSRLYNIYEWGHCAGFFHFNEEMTTTTTMRIAKTKTTITHDDKR